MVNDEGVMSATSFAPIHQLGKVDYQYVMMLHWLSIYNMTIVVLIPSLIFVQPLITEWQL